MVSFRIFMPAALVMPLLAAACAEDPMAFRKAQMESYESRFEAASDAVSDAGRSCPDYIAAHSDIVAADRAGQEAAARAFREAESATTLAYVNRRSAELTLQLADKAVTNRCLQEADYLYDALLRNAGDPVLRERARQKKAAALILRETSGQRR